jgi:hypothetical protein
MCVVAIVLGVVTTCLQVGCASQTGLTIANQGVRPPGSQPSADSEPTNASGQSAAGLVNLLADLRAQFDRELVKAVASLRAELRASIEARLEANATIKAAGGVQAETMQAEVAALKSDQQKLATELKDVAAGRDVKTRISQNSPWPLVAVVALFVNPPLKWSVWGWVSRWRKKRRRVKNIRRNGGIAPVLRIPPRYSQPP